MCAGEAGGVQHRVCRVQFLRVCVHLVREGGQTESAAGHRVGRTQQRARQVNLPAARRTQPITIGQNFFNNPCPIATMVTW